MEHVDLQVESEIKLDFDELVEILQKWLQDRYEDFSELKHVKLNGDEVSVRFVRKYQQPESERHPVYKLTVNIAENHSVDMYGYFDNRGNLYIIEISDESSTFFDDMIYNYLVMHPDLTVESIGLTSNETTKQGTPVILAEGKIKVE